jgi:hypothetical protein
VNQAGGEKEDEENSGKQPSPGHAGIIPVSPRGRGGPKDCISRLQPLDFPPGGELPSRR